MSVDYAAGAADAAVLVRLFLERAALERRPLEYVRSEVERVELELAVLASPGNREVSGMAFVDRLGGSRKGGPVVAQIAAQEGAVERARRDLAEVEAECVRRREAAVGRVESAERKLDGRRRALIGECAKAWRAAAERKRVELERAPVDAVESRMVRFERFLAPDQFEERVRPVREWLRRELAGMEAVAAKLERQARPVEATRTPQGDPAWTGPVGEQLASIVAGLEWPEEGGSGGG